MGVMLFLEDPQSQASPCLEWPLPALPWLPEPHPLMTVSFRILEDLPIKLSN